MCAPRSKSKHTRVERTAVEPAAGFILLICMHLTIFFAHMQLLVESLASSLPALANLGCIFILVFFVFAALAVSLFGTLCVEGEAGLAGMGAVRCFFAGEDVLGLHGNFRHFGEALGTLFRAQTGDAWADILNVIARSPADHTRTVTAFEWDKLSGLLGYDPRELKCG